MNFEQARMHLYVHASVWYHRREVSLDLAKCLERGPHGVRLISVNDHKLNMCLFIEIDFDLQEDIAVSVHW